VYYLQGGRVRLSVISKQGKEATIALLGAGVSWVSDVSPPINPFGWRLLPQQRRVPS